MDNVKALILFLTVSFPSVVFASVAGTEVANIQSWLMNTTDNQLMVKPNPQTDTYSRNYVTQDNRYVNVVSKADYRAINGRIYPITIEKTGEIDGSKVGKAVVRMAKFLPPLALGVEVYNLVCELSDICKKDNADEWEKVTQDYELLDPSTNTTDCSSIPQGASYIDYSAGNYLEIQRIDSYVHCPGNPNLSNQGYTIQTYCATPGGSCSYQAIWHKNVSTLPETQRAPVTDSDWTNAETQLNDPRFDEPLLANGQAVPLKNLPIFGNNPPVQLSDSETVIRDSQGNITGTRRTITQLELSDGATSSQPGRVTGTETQTQTDYDTQGQPTGTTIIETTPPPPEKPTEPTETQVQFDTVPDDVQIPTVEHPVTFDSTSWGAGFCPQSPTMTTFTGHQLIFDLQPACDTASQLRPFVLIIATIISAFIIIGAKVE